MRHSVILHRIEEQRSSRIAGDPFALPDRTKVRCNILLLNFADIRLKFDSDFYTIQKPGNDESSSVKGGALKPILFMIDSFLLQKDQFSSFMF